MTAAVETVRRALVDEVAFLAWTESAVPGDHLAYHEGLLGVDRVPGPSALPESQRHELDRVAGHAMALAEAGRLLLAQRRVGDRLAYLAIKAGKPKTKGWRR